MDNLLLVLCYLTFSLVLILVGLVNWYRLRQFVQTAQRTTGIVIDFVPRGGRGRPTYSPTVRFKTIEGREVEFTEALSSRPPGYEINEQVPVLYDPENPEHARVFKSHWRLYYFALLYGGLGIVFFIVYLVVLITQNINSF